MTETNDDPYWTDERVNKLNSTLDEWSEKFRKLQCYILATKPYPELAKRVQEAEEENSRLRAAIANGTSACIYCSLPKEDWLKCQHGFPGCGRGDDAVNCPHLGASLELEAERRIVAHLTETIQKMAYTPSSRTLSMMEVELDPKKLEAIRNPPPPPEEDIPF